MLIVVVCAIALSLAYPVREYLAQLRQIDQLKAQQTQITAQLRQLKAQRRELASPAYVEQQARDRLHMCLPAQTCYVIISGNKRSAQGSARARRRHAVVRAAVVISPAGGQGIGK